LGFQFLDVFLVLIGVHCASGGSTVATGDVALTVRSHLYSFDSATPLAFRGTSRSVTLTRLNEYAPRIHRDASGNSGDDGKG
jgi:hypothetical protein